MTKVYLSSTRLDLEAERQAVTDWLIAAGHQPVHSYVADSETVSDSCLDDIDGCELYLLILGYRYGFVPETENPEHLSITQMEFRRAGELEIPRLALLSTSVPDIRLTDLNDPDRSQRVHAFRTEVARALRPAEFRDQAALIAALSTGVQRTLAKQTGRTGDQVGIPSKAPPAPQTRREPPETLTAPPGCTSRPNGSWWSTLPGILTGAATLIVAITGLIALFVNRDKPPVPTLPPPPATGNSYRQAEPITDKSASQANPKAQSQEVKIGDIGAGATVSIKQKQ